MELNMSSVAASRGRLSAGQSPKTKIESKEVSNGRKTYPVISVIGFSRLSDRAYSKRLKIFWASILIAVITICIHQIADFVGTYLDCRAMKDLIHVRTTNVTFPIIYLCPGFMRAVLFALLASDNDKSSKDIHKSLLETINEQINQTSIDVYWREELVVALESLHVYIACSELNSKNCTQYGQEISVKAIPIPSFWGTCLALTTNFTVPFRGPFTCLTIKHVTLKAKTDDVLANRIQAVRASISGIQNPSLLFYVRSDLSRVNNHQLFYTAQMALEGFETHFGMSMKKFDLFDAKTERCSKTNRFTNCFNDCLDRHLSQITSKCKMPYVLNNTLPVCDSTNANEAYLQSYTNYLNYNYSSCICHQDCLATTYSTTSNVIAKLRDNLTTVMQIFFTDDSYEKTISRPAYGFSVMISDIGGMLGFYLGFCSLSMFEILEFLFAWISARR